MKWTWKDTGAIAAITLVVCIFFYRLFWPVPQIIITPDFGLSDALGAFSTNYYYGIQLSAHRFPLWTSLFGGGYPIFALGFMGTFVVSHLLFYSILPPVVAYNVTLVFSLCFMGWGMYSWLRLMGYRRVSSIFGSITTVLSGYCIVQLTHITIVQSYSFFPWLAALVLYLSRKKSWLTVGWFIFLLSQQIFMGFPQCVFITLLFIGAYWLWLLRKNVDIVQKTLFLGIAICGGCIGAAVQILPSVEFLRALTTASGFSSGQATFYSYPFKHLITLLDPFALGNPATGTYPHFSAFSGSIFWENTAYIGIAPLVVLALYSAVALWKKLRPASIVFFILVLFGSFLLMTGGHSPLYLIYSFWPFNLFRVPSRFIWLFDIALIILCVHAFDRLVGYGKKSKIIFFAALLVICIHTMSLYMIWRPYHDLAPATDWRTKPALSQSVDRSGYTISIGAEQVYNDFYAPHGWLNLEGKNDPTYFLQNTLTPDKSILWSVPQIGDYTGRSIHRSSVLTDLLAQYISTDTQNATISATGRKLLTLLSVKNVISALPLTQDGLLFNNQISDGEHTISLYTNPDALPAVYFAQQAVPAHTVEDAVAVFTSEAFIPGNMALVEFEATPAATLRPGNVVIAESGEGHYAVDVANPNNSAILVLTQTYYPGWHATIEGRDVPIFPVNIRHIGILVPAGSHAIEFTYRPDSFVVGAWISGISLGITTFLMVFGFVYSGRRTHQKVLLRGPRHPGNRGMYLPHKG